MKLQRQCKICGCYFDVAGVTSPAKYCKPCKPIANRDSKRRSRLRSLDGRSYGSYWVLYDPDPIAGFCKGMKVSREENVNMLRMSCFTPGTLLRSVDGICYEVVQKVTKQMLVEHRS
jgi:hypothetical protein